MRYRPKLIYTNPTFHNPTGATMPIRMRRELLSLAQRYRVPIVEDATYRDLYFNDVPPPSLRELDDHNLVIYLNSFSKVMAPGLRLGWIAAAPSIVEQIAIIKQRLDPHTPNLVQMAVARLMHQGAFDAHLRGLRTEHAKRCTQMIAAIQRHMPAGSIRFARPTGGLYLWCRLGAGLSATALHERALAAGVTFVPGPGFLPGSGGGLGAAPLLYQRPPRDGGREHQAPGAVRRRGSADGLSRATDSLGATDYTDHTDIGSLIQLRDPWPPRDPWLNKTRVIRGPGLD